MKFKKYVSPQKNNEIKKNNKNRQTTELSMENTVNPNNLIISPKIQSSLI